MLNLCDLHEMKQVLWLIGLKDELVALAFLAGGVETSTRVTRG